jgi:hypothetical protein
MAIRRSQTQHRQAAEETNPTAELRETKQENRRLKRELVRLRKQLMKLLQNQPDLDDDVVEPESKEVAACPECQSEKLKKIVVAGKNFSVCPECKWKKLQTD